MLTPVSGSLDEELLQEYKNEFLKRAVAND